MRKVSGLVRRALPGRSVPGRRREVDRRRREIDRRRPVQLVALGFLVGIAAGTGLLMLPVATAGEGSASLVEALFTAVSAICVTGLLVVDTATYWSGFGQVVVLVLIQVGGFGVMTLASLLGLMISRHLGLQNRLVAAASTRSVGLGEVGTVLLGILRVTVVVEGLTALVLTTRWTAGYDLPLGRAAWLGVFHAVSAFNNAGFTLWSDNLVPFATDAWIILPISAAVVVGGLGFPVLLELWRNHTRPSRWSLQTTLTLLTTAVLVGAGTVFVLTAEWSNPATLGRLDEPGRVLAGFFHAVVPRTAGFNSVDVAEMNTGTLLGTDVLMFIGGGSGGTAGGIKVTTFSVLAFAIWSELRGDRDVTALRRRVSSANLREALTVALLSVAMVIVPAGVIAMTSAFSLDKILFEVISAFATVGLSTGITADLSAPHQLILCVLMFVGRLGPITLGSALAMRPREQAFRYPEQTTLIG